MKILSRGFAWLDTGSHKALTEATEFVKAFEKSTALKTACLENIALTYKWIPKENHNHLKGDYDACFQNLLIK